MRLQKTEFYKEDGYEKMPVLFIPFCKKETAEKVFAAIRKSRPKKLYIFSDGARLNIEGEKEKVEYLRKRFVENVDWDCEVFCNFQDKNLGTRFGIEAAIDWFFEKEEMGIILEDDCLPAPSFFRFCSEMLIKYKDEEKVFLINGTNETAKNVFANSYSFKKVTDFSEDVTGIWGWATWKRAWLKHDKSMSKLAQYKRAREIDDNSQDYEKYIKDARIKILTDQMGLILSEKNNTWDLQLKFSALISDALFLVCDCNLVTNIGCGVSKAAHAAFEYNVGATLAAGEVRFPLEHPKEVSARPLTAREFRRASFFPVLDGMDFWEMEMNITEEMRIINDFLDKSAASLSREQKNEIYRPVAAAAIHRLFLTCLLYKEYAKAQKYLHSALSKDVFTGEKNFCAGCAEKKCMLVCPTKSVFAHKLQNGELLIAINRETCFYCWKCMKSCPAANPA